MISVVKYEAKHLEELLKEDIPLMIKSLMTPGKAKALELNRHTFTGISEDGRVLVCAGVTEYWPGRGEAWAIFNPKCRKEFLSIHHAVRRFLNICPVKRVEASVKVGFEEGHRWVKSLGFKLEAERLEAFLPDGSDVSLYSRVRL